MMFLIESLFWSTFFSFILSIAVMIFKIVAYWFLFEKAEEDGWKTLIPFYSEYILCKIAKREKLFWWMLGALGATLILPFLTGLGIGITSIAAATSHAGKIFGLVLAIIAYFCYLVITILLIVISIKLCLSLAEAFGQPRAFGVGLFFLEPVFIGILAFGSSVYLKEENKKSFKSDDELKLESDVNEGSSLNIE